MKTRISISPELGNKISKTCYNCGRFFREIHHGAVTILICKGETHSAIIVEHPKGQGPAIFTRDGLRSLGDPDRVSNMILGKSDAQQGDLVCPRGCGYVTDSAMAYKRHSEFCSQ